MKSTKKRETTQNTFILMEDGKKLARVLDEKKPIPCG